MNAARSIRNVTTLSLVFFVTLTVKADLPLGEIPADAHIIITVNNIEESESKLKTFAEGCGIPLSPKLSIQELLKSVGAPGIAETKRGMAVVGMTPEPNGMVVFVPIIDPKNALAKLKAQPDGKFHRFSVGDKPVYANVRRNWLVTAFDPEALKTLNAVDKTVESNWSAARKQVMASSDVFVYFGIQRWRPVIEKGLDEVLEQLKETPLPENAAMPGIDVMEFLRWEFQAVRSLLKQTNAVYGGISVDASRVQAQFHAAFAPGSYLQVLAKSQPTPRPNLLDNLPDRPFSMAMGLDSQSLKRFLVDMVKSMTELPKFGKFVRDNEYKETLEQSLAFYKELNGFNMAFNFGPAGMEGAGRYFYDDPRGARQQMHSLIQVSGSLPKPGRQLEP